MAKVKVHNMAGEAVSEQELPAAIFGLKVKPSVIQLAAVAQQANARVAIADTKDRSQVAGGGRKPWRQKGTGRARHGSIRSPLWRGGGVTFGPTSKRNFSLKVNRRLRRQAILMCLSDKAADGKIVLLDELKVPAIKTKQITDMLRNLQLRPKPKGKAKADAQAKASESKVAQRQLSPSVLVVLAASDSNTQKSVRNMVHVSSISANSLNVVELLRHQVLLLPVAAIKEIERTFVR